MLWLFVFLGLVAFSSAGLGFLATVRGRSIDSGLHFTALFLTGTAWVSGHDRPMGWTVLLLALLLETATWCRRMTIAWWREQSVASNAPEIIAKSVEADSAAELTPFDPMDSSAAMQSAASAREATISGSVEFRTIGLLRSPWQLTGEVFLASLRRGGQREARLCSDGEAESRFEIGAILLELVYSGRPAETGLIDYACGQTFDWPEATQIASQHRAHVLLRTLATQHTPREEILRLHRRAHAALAEFAPVSAILWPDAGRLAPPDANAKEIDIAPTRTCVSFRTFSLDGPEAGMTLCDTAGLHAFGLPDIQVIVEGEPDAGVSALMYQWAERFFRQGCGLQDGATVNAPGSENWIARKAEARFAPARMVIELQRRQA